MFVLIIVFCKQFNSLILLNITKQFIEETYFFIKVNIYIFYIYFQYLFLNTVWDTYNEFDKSVDGDPYKHMYEVLCNQFMMQLGENKEKHTNFCLKLVRNLGCYNSDSKYYNPNNDRCNILYNWIYNTKKNDIRSKIIIDKCFDDYNILMNYTTSMNRCSYISHDDTYVEPKKISILNIFDDNMSIIKEALAQEYNTTDSPSQKYVCECVKIYKEMYREYCNDKNSWNTKREKTCERLNNFKTTYMEYIFNKLDKNDKIPSLYNVEYSYSNKCKANEKNLERASTEFQNKDGLQSKIVMGGEGMSIFSLPSTDDVENQVSPMSRTVSTAVGTVAGASSILALLYKVNEEFHLIL
ncbi:hypothetical protein PVIIG_05229 [Plasmodium vivax India VII]|uniref:Uncharacterized protein n=1 Tax=Plasmodium vivax India VII TaxID=1077284 RepID=A0A0J9S4T2_PLAVI|nr:hypothetical protein PVIIG_05229 [Plasmodium vivax India VII]